MCEYCRDVINLTGNLSAEPLISKPVTVKIGANWSNIPDYINFELYIDDKTNLVLLTSFGSFDVEWFRQPIRFCPICGEQLVELDKKEDLPF